MYDERIWDVPEVLVWEAIVEPELEPEPEE